MKNIDLTCGNGGLEMHTLINDIIKPPIKNNCLDLPTDSAKVLIDKTALLFTTDSHIIDPVFFPGGDIGKLAVCGTVNDLLVSGAMPLYLSLSLILEEGLPVEDLSNIMDSIKIEAEHTGIMIVTGDTKVTERGKGDKIFINTSGIGRPVFDPLPHFNNICVNDDIIITGGIARHGIAILMQREGIRLENRIMSDVCSLHPIIYALKDNGIIPKYMTDPTRGGISAALNEIASSTRLGIEIFEQSIPIDPSVNAVCEILGLDPYEIASEGIAIIITDNKDTEKALKIIKDCGDLSHDAGILGKVTKKDPSRVILSTRAKTQVLLSFPQGLNLPRIC